MTLISFGLYGDHAEIVTDTSAYTSSGDHFGRTSKGITIPHLDAMILTQGDVDFGVEVEAAALRAVPTLPTFDALVEAVQTWLATPWQARSLSPDPDESTVFLVGWSAMHEAFKGYAFAAEQAWRRIEIKQTWIMPTPWGNRPSGMELRRIRAWIAATDPDALADIAEWPTQPPVSRPETEGEWIALATRAREQRSLNGAFGRVVVAGDLFHTRLERGAVATRRVHTFNDEGDELLRMVEGSRHPLALAAPCGCGSGDAFADCHAE